MEQSNAMQLNNFLENNCKEPFDFWAYIFTLQYQLKRKDYAIITLPSYITKSGKDERLIIKDNK